MDPRFGGAFSVGRYRQWRHQAERKSRHLTDFGELTPLQRLIPVTTPKRHPILRRTILEHRKKIRYRLQLVRSTTGRYVMNRKSSRVVTGRTLVVINNRNFHPHAFLPSATLAVTSRQKASHRCFLAEAPSPCASQVTTNGSEPGEDSYAWA